MRLEVAENEAPKPPRVEECGDGIPFQLTMGSGVARVGKNHDFFLKIKKIRFF